MALPLVALAISHRTLSTRTDRGFDPLDHGILDLIQIDIQDPIREMTIEMSVSNEICHPATLNMGRYVSQFYHSTKYEDIFL